MGVNKMGKTIRKIVENNGIEKIENYGSKTYNFKNHEKFDKDCDIIVVMKNRGYGLIPFKLYLTQQLSIADLENELQEDEEIEEFVVISVNSSKYISVAKVENEYIPDDINALMRRKEESIEEVRCETEDAISDLKSDMDCDISDIKRVYDEKIEKAKQEKKEK